ncbi:hypothetical protein ACWWJM_22780, partial [Enterobacter hormaechei]
MRDLILQLSKSSIYSTKPNVDRLKQHKGKCFNTVADRDPSNDLSKEAFATHIVNAHKNDIDFSRFTSLLERLEKVIDHYNLIK